MSITYLFRIDAAKDNDHFFASLQSSALQVYAGVDIRIGSSGWVPDLIKVTINELTQVLSLTLIELEAIESDALISCRKYLPEDSASIVGMFCQYLERVIRKCRSTADPRKNEFVRLRNFFSTVDCVVVTTAGALRSSSAFVEDLPLIDQPQGVALPQFIPEISESEVPAFHGTMRLSAHEAKGFRRSIMILDAIIRKRDQSVAEFKSWRAHTKVQPLKYLLKEKGEEHPHLRAFLANIGKSGITLDCDAHIAELSKIWSNNGSRKFNEEHVRKLIVRYFPASVEIKNHENMRTIFDAARKQLADLIWA